MNRDEFIDELAGNCDEALSIVQKKNQDYAADEDPFQNFRMVEDAGLMSAEEGLAVRMSDKMQRVFNLLDSDAAVEDERIEDTLLDLMNYSNILLTLINDRRPEKVDEEGRSVK